MKLYTNESQTAKLIELGFEKPKGWCVEGISSRLIMYKHKEDDEGFNYSIGELLSLLPICFETDNDDTSWLEIEAGAIWSVSYSSFGSIDYDCEREELIDALFDMIVKLKEEGVI